MSRAKEHGRQSWNWVRYIDWFYNMGALARAPSPIFDEYVPDGQREYQRGEVVRIKHEKYLLENWGKIDPAIPPDKNPLCKLFRDGGRYPYVPKEYCLKGYPRYWEDANPEREGWFEVIAEMVDDSTPPPDNVSLAALADRE